MRGLTLFIADLRKCRGKEEEIKRINKELANIRSKFKGDKPLNGYHKKKYVCKLLFMFLLGHKCDFGFMEAVNLLSSNAYSEKQIGYLFISVIMNEDHKFIPLIINCLRSDLSSGYTVFQNLALQFIANSPNEDIADSLCDIVLELLLSSDTVDFVRQTAALTLLQLLRIKSDLFFDACKTSRIMNLISCRHLGLLTASISLIDFLSKKSPFQYASCLPHCVGRLDKIVSSAYLDYQDYTYYEIAAPWLTVKLLRLMQNFSAPTEFAVKTRLRNALDIILNRADESNSRSKQKKFEHNNAKYAILFDAISLIIHMDLEAPLLYKAISILGNILKYRDVNLRFMALDLMTQLTENEVYLGNIRMYWQSILDALSNERDITVRKQAIDLLYNICDRNNAKCIVKGMLIFIETEPESAHDAVLKAAALAEKFNSDLKWYVDTVFTSLQISKNFVEEDVWYTLVRVIATSNNIQEYAAESAFSALLQSNCHDMVIKVAGYILGEYGYLISQYPPSSQTKQLSILREKYISCSYATRSLLLTTFMKFLNVYPELKQEIQLILRDKINVESSDLELQQRAVEYYKLSKIASKILLATVFEEIPLSPKEESTVFKAIERRKSIIFKPDERIIRKNSLSAFSMRSLGPKSTHADSIVSKSISNPHLQGNSNSSSNLKLLLDAFRETPAVRANPFTLLIPEKINFAANENFLHNLLFNEKGVLFENDTMRILIQCEFNKNFGRFHMTYQNRSSKMLTEFTVEGDFACTEKKCSIWFKPNTTVLGIEGSIEQDIHMECLSEFSGRPSLNLKFLTDQTEREIKVFLPLTVNKFSEPVAMNAQDYMKRWGNLGNLGQDVVRKFRSKNPMIRGVVQMKLMGFRVSVIEHISTDPKQFYCAGVFYSRSERTGFLFQLTAIPEEIEYQVVVRSSQKSLSENISDLLYSLL